MLSSDSRSDLEQQRVIQSLSLRVRMLEALLESLPGEIREHIQTLSAFQVEQELRLQTLEESIESIMPELQAWRHRSSRYEQIEHLVSIYSADGEPICNYTELKDF